MVWWWNGDDMIVCVDVWWDDGVPIGMAFRYVTVVNDGAIIVAHDRNIVDGLW